VKRRYRIALVAAFSVSGAIAILGLSALGDASEGPLSAALGWIGAAAGSVEHRVRDRLAGPPRRETMRWLEPYRTSAERLRKPDFVLLGAYDSGIPRTLDGILTLESIRKRAVVIESPSGDAIGIRPQMFMCLGFDHRATDGAQAGKFVAEVKRWLEAVDSSTAIW